MQDAAVLDVGKSEAGAAAGALELELFMSNLETGEIGLRNRNWTLNNPLTSSDRWFWSIYKCAMTLKYGQASTWKTGLNWKRDKRQHDTFWINFNMNQSRYWLHPAFIIPGETRLYKFETHSWLGQSPLRGTCVEIQAGAGAPVNYYHWYFCSQFYWKLMPRELGYCREWSRDAENMSQQFIQ